MLRSILTVTGTSHALENIGSHWSSSSDDPIFSSETGKGNLSTSMNRSIASEIISDVNADFRGNISECLDNVGIVAD